MPAVWLPVYGERRPGGRSLRSRPRSRSTHCSGYLRELPLRMSRRRRAQFFGRSHLCDQRRPVAPLLHGAGKVKLDRWDVAVFKLPEEPDVRYIKRLVGMPNEIVRIEGGDLWARPLSREGAFQRLRRTLDHQQAMQFLVYDDAHRPAALRHDPRWQRLAPARQGDWTEPTPGEFVPADGAATGSSSAISISFRPRNIGGPSARAPPCLRRLVPC